MSLGSWEQNNMYFPCFSEVELTKRDQEVLDEVRKEWLPSLNLPLGGWLPPPLLISREANFFVKTYSKYITKAYSQID